MYQQMTDILNFIQLSIFIDVHLFHNVLLLMVSLEELPMTQYQKEFESTLTKFLQKTSSHVERLWR